MGFEPDCCRRIGSVVAGVGRGSITAIAHRTRRRPLYRRGPDLPAQPARRPALLSASVCALGPGPGSLRSRQDRRYFPRLCTGRLDPARFSQSGANLFPQLPAGDAAGRLSRSPDRDRQLRCHRDQLLRAARFYRGGRRAPARPGTGLRRAQRIHRPLWRGYALRAGGHQPVFYTLADAIAALADLLFARRGALPGGTVV